VADVLPVDTTSPAIARLDVPAAAVEAEARRLWAERNLRIAAREAGMTADEYRKAGLLAEQQHQLVDLDADASCPFEGACRYPYLTAGGTS
jgi:hypothetical protein